jgi:hypothetical protein
MHVNDIYNRLFRIWRSKRFQLFVQTLQPTSQTTILDIGGYPQTWMAHPPVAKSITCINLHRFEWDPAVAPEHDIRVEVGDACKLPFEDASFDIVFSNSVIEHVGSWENQQAFAREVQRVGKKYWVQTPAFECPIEAHYLAPFVHWLPQYWQRAAVAHLTPWAWIQRPTEEQIDEMFATIRLLRSSEMRALFTDAEITQEYLAGFIPKSHIAFRREQVSGVAR